MLQDGYLKNDSNNSQDSNFFDYMSEKAYLTGDLGFYKDGLLYYKGRKDKQIKYKGYRIELSDIESNLLKLNYVEKAIVKAKKNVDNKILGLVAFVKLSDNIKKTDIEIRNDLKKLLPIYMCPRIKIVEKFKLNANGKVDEEDLWKIK